MSPRVLVLLLVLANVAFFVWTQGWLDVGVSSIGDREPERLARQVNPESLRILSPEEAASVAQLVPTEPATLPVVVVAAPTPAVPDPASVSVGAVACLEAGPFTKAEVELAEQSVQNRVPRASWVRRGIEAPGRWIIYMGKYPDKEAMKKKANELSRIKVAYDEVRFPPELRPGLSLGGYNSRAAADAALTELRKRGVNSAKVVIAVQPAVLYALRVDHADADLAKQLTSLEGDAVGRRFVACELAKGR